MQKDKLISRLENIRNELDDLIKSLREEEKDSIVSEDDYRDMMSILSTRPFIDYDCGDFGEQ
jgi:ribosome recycling factor